MSGKYSGKKGFAKAKIQKHNEELFLALPQVKKLLTTVLSVDGCTKARDHAVLFLGFHLALRISECASLERDNFRDIGRGVIYVRRLKQAKRLDVRCPACRREFKVAARRAGTVWRCTNCQQEINVPAGTPNIIGAPERKMPTVEGYVSEYLTEYLTSQMRPNQRFLFESSVGVHLSAETLRKIFNTYAELSGLPKVYSFHALRHGRGVQVYEAFHDPLAVREMLGHKSSATADIYMHMSPARSAEVRDKLERQSVI